jgi:hypothetical protein
MANAGFEVPDIQDLDSVTALFLKDPDGIPFEISHTRQIGRGLTQSWRCSRATSKE